jgi:steroid 5-alpha reductase family enzyme
MIAAIASRIALAWAIAAALQLVLWRVQQRTRNAGIVDVGWAASFALVIALFAARATAPAAAWAPLAAIACAWSLRLAGYLIARGAARAPEDSRYAELRRRWTPHVARRFLVFFQAQAALTGVLSLALIVPFVAAPWDTGWLRALGAALAIAGIAGEAVADAQLARWRRDPARTGQVCDVGLWAYSRHPNYFFECWVWLGYAVYSLAFWPHGAIALVGPALIITSILTVTGIPATEAQALRSKGDAYRRYQRTTSALIPLPRRRVRPH